MNIDQFVLLSSMLGDELYREAGKQATATIPSVEKQYQLLANKPIGAFMTSGLPTFWPRKKTVLRFY
ncbi:hypothetical protein ACAW74_17340 [Fibrella sp. WM1]|uniref:hypothetical protein n=1 Tax=Fibrella musci TaxID=3242485 RepID=UPI003522F2F9